MGTLLLGYVLFNVCVSGTLFILIGDDSPIKLDENGNEVE